MPGSRQYSELLVNRKENDTTIFGKSYGLQGRALKTKVINKIQEIESNGGTFEEIYPLMAGKRVKEAWETGDVDRAPLMVGQSVGLINDIPTCQELLETMVREAEETFSKTSGLVQPD